MHIVRALACALTAAALAAPAFPAGKKQQAALTQEDRERTRAEEARRRAQLELSQAEEQRQQRVEEERQRLAAAGYVVGRPFRDCPACPEMVVIPGGGYDMGSPADEVGRYSAEGPQHRVTIAAPFALGRTEVTQGQWRALMGSDPSGFSACGDDCPVERVSWNEAQEYAAKLSAQTGKRYRLPSEAEWEYAARAGMMTAFNTGNCIDTGEANYDGRYDYNYCRARKREFRQRTLPVASFAANGFGLHDMHGNVWEWVEDCWHDDYQGAPGDGAAWVGAACDKRVLRGGSWNVEPRALRSAERNWEWAGDRGDSQGFRVARTLF